MSRAEALGAEGQHAAAEVAQVAMGDLAGMGGAGPRTLAQIRCTRAAGLNFSTGNWTRLRRRTPKPLQSALPAFRAGRPSRLV